MYKEEHVFPATGDLLSSYISNCKYSRAAWKFLSKHSCELDDEFSCVQLFSDSEEVRHYAWCFIQRIESRYWLRVIHLDGDARSLLEAPDMLCRNADDSILHSALNVLNDENMLPPQTARDVIHYVKEHCRSQLLELSYAESGDDDSKRREQQYLIRELMFRCNALGG
jgi:hypothetical protein